MVAVPLLLAVLVETSADAFGPHLGAVVAHGVRRAPAGPAATPTTFAELAAFVGSSDFERLLAGSRDARSLPSAASKLAALLERSGVDPGTFGLEPP